MKGFPKPIHAFEVVGESSIESRFEALRGAKPTPLVGREEEVDLLRRQWHRATSGEGRVVLISGEPGIGKSRLSCQLCALLGQYEELLEKATKIVDICELHGYTATRRGSGIRWRGHARSHLGELDAGIDDVRESLVLWRGHGVVFHTPEKACEICDLLLRAGRIEDASQMLDDAKYMGDGVLVYFGFPQARENAAEQAVRAGLALW